MFKYLLLFVLLAPLVGIILMERGEFGGSIGAEGYPNGAALAYAFYALVLLITTAVVIRGAGVAAPSRGRIALLGLPARDNHFQATAIALLLISSAVLMMMLFGFGGIEVISGAVSKSEFRTSLGPFGAVAHMMTKLVVPAGLAYCAFEYRQSRKSAFNLLLLGFNMAVALLIGLTWGFKSTGLFMLLPALLILYWRVRFGQIVAIASGSLLVLLWLFYLFDAEVAGTTDALTFLWMRATVLQGDVSWDIWNRYVAGEEFPPYARTLLPVLGDRVFAALTGIERSDYTNWVDYHYDLLLTYVSGIPLELVESGYTITGTPFSEGLIAGGLVGVFVFALIGGSLVGGTYRLISSARRRGDSVQASLAATFFCMNVFPWLYGGAVLQLVHASVVVGYAGMYVVLRGACHLVLIARNGRALRPGSADESGGVQSDLRG